jgi:hypothetical protein
MRKVFLALTVAAALPTSAFAQQTVPIGTQPWRLVIIAGTGGGATINTSLYFDKEESCRKAATEIEKPGGQVRALCIQASGS